MVQANAEVSSPPVTDGLITALHAEGTQPTPQLQPSPSMQGKLRTTASLATKVSEIEALPEQPASEGPHSEALSHDTTVSRQSSMPEASRGSQSPHSRSVKRSFTSKATASSVSRIFRSRPSMA